MLKVTYGNFDITDKFLCLFSEQERARINNPYNSLFGDPQFGTRKELKIITSEKTYTFLENTPLAFSLQNGYFKLIEHFLAIFAVFEDSQEMETWIEHYLQEGVDHFYVITNHTNIANKYKNKITFSHEEKSKLFDECVKNSQWILSVDVKDLFYTHSNYSTIKTYLQTLSSDISRVKVNDTKYLMRCESVINPDQICLSDDGLSSDDIISFACDSTDKKLKEKRKRFDWIAYVLNSPDLYFLKKEDEAIQHYENFGRKENRLLPLQLKTDKLYKIKLYGGLTNQLVELTNALILAHYTGRNVCVPKFNTEYNKDKYVNSEEVIDIKHLNNLLGKFNLNSRIVFHCTEKFTSSRYAPIWKGHTMPNGNIVDLILALRQEQETYLDLGCTYMAYEPGLENKRNNSFLCIHELTYKIIASLKFQPVYYELAEKYKPKNNYTAVHMRIENDMALDRFHKLPFYIWHWIKQNIEDEYLFLATYLLKSPNKYNYIAQDCIDNYKVTMTPRIFDDRELNAIVDLLICQQAENFLGFRHSTFTLAIIYKRRKDKRPFQVIRTDGNNFWLSEDITY